MKILITETGRYVCQSLEEPEVGRYYILEDATSGTAAQNRAFHSLLDAFWKWMFDTNTFVFQDGEAVFDLSTPSPADFKDYFKYKYGAGFSHVQFVDEQNQIIKVKSLSDVPDYVIKDFNDGNRLRVKGVLKSWADYTKPERKKAIDMLLKLVAVSECTDKKVMDIISGMEKHDE